MDQQQPQSNPEQKGKKIYGQIAGALIVLFVLTLLFGNQIFRLITGAK
jgi:hypothetical protein